MINQTEKQSSSCGLGLELLLSTLFLLFKVYFADQLYFAYQNRFTVHKGSIKTCANTNNACYEVSVVVLSPTPCAKN